MFIYIVLYIDVYDDVYNIMCIYVKYRYRLDRDQIWYKYRLDSDREMMQMWV